MPPIETEDLLDKAVLWAYSGTDNYGQPVVGEPAEIDVRWIRKRREASSPQGGTIILDAQAVVAQEIAIGSEIWLGELEDWYATGSSGDDTEVMRVATYDEAEDIRGIETRRTVGLQRFRNQPSTS